MKFQQAERSTSLSQTKFLGTYRHKSKYDQQIMAIIAEKMARPGRGVRPCGYYKRLGGDDPLASGKSEEEQVQDGFQDATKRFFSFMIIGTLLSLAVMLSC